MPSIRWKRAVTQADEEMLEYMNSQRGRKCEPDKQGETQHLYIHDWTTVRGCGAERWARTTLRHSTAPQLDSTTCGVRPWCGPVPGLLTGRSGCSNLEMEELPYLGVTQHLSLD